MSNILQIEVEKNAMFVSTLQIVWPQIIPLIYSMLRCESNNKGLTQLSPGSSSQRRIRGLLKVMLVTV
jgi:hypothetical protein